VGKKVVRGFRAGIDLKMRNSATRGEAAERDTTRGLRCHHKGAKANVLLTALTGVLRTPKLCSYFSTE